MEVCLSIEAKEEVEHPETDIKAVRSYLEQAGFRVRDLIVIQGVRQ